MYIRRMTAAFARAECGRSFTLVTRASRLKNLFHTPALPAANFSSKLMLEGLHPFFARSTDVFHGLDARLPGRWMKAKTVVTIHDVFSALQSTEFATDEFRSMKRQRYAELVTRADRIICVSEAVRRDVLLTLSPDPAKLRVVYEAGGEGFFPRNEPEIADTRRKHGLDRPYLIFVGSINKRKNVPALIQAFDQARAHAGADVLFAIAGRMGFGGETIRDTIARCARPESIRLLGYVPDADIAPLYSGAVGLLFATLYEGFGIPAIEAFACGCPVIGATTGSLPEIVADAGLLADPSSVNAIAEQIERLITDEPLRQSLAQRGLARARQFSWDKAATECLAIYAELCR
jgi:glycosyltransferase involved in cell wall biosynthesis